MDIHKMLLGIVATFPKGSFDHLLDLAIAFGVAHLLSFFG
jgi:hypothetical protein